MQTDADIGNKSCRKEKADKIRVEGGEERKGVEKKWRRGRYELRKGGRKKRNVRSEEMEEGRKEQRWAEPYYYFLQTGAGQ
jgi:hypothetical protein